MISYSISNIEDYIPLLPYIQQSYAEDTHVILLDLEKIIASLPGKQLRMPVNINDQIENMKSTVSYKAIMEKKTIRDERGPEQFGISYIATAVPVFNQGEGKGELIGLLTAVTSNQNQHQLRADAHELASMIEELSATTDEIAQASVKISDESSDLAKYANEMAQDVDNIHKVINFVKNVASQSNLLGLNAAIEAARAGDAGRGFGVVSDEIRKMAVQSKDSSEEIRKNLDTLQRSLTNLNEAVNRLSLNQEAHTSNVEDLRSVFNQISRVADDLVRRSNVE